MKLKICLPGCLLLVLFLATPAVAGDKLMFTISRTQRPVPAKESSTVFLDWQELQRRLPSIGENNVIITDANFGKQAEHKVIDVNQDGKPDFVAIDFTFNSNEPVFAFRLETTQEPVRLTTGVTPSPMKFELTYLTPSGEWLKSGKVIKSWPDKIIESTMAFYPDPIQLTVYSPNQWNYEYGFFLNATFERWRKTQNPDYLRYLKRWADHFIDSHGAIDPKQYRVDEYRLDDILPGRLFVSLYEITGQEKYKNAAAQLASQLLYQPKTSDGGYWHKQIYPNQMWLDGVYMADIFSMQYGVMFKDPKFINEAINQIKLVAEHTTDPATGLMYHGWDESLNKVWANPDTGTSPEFWSRAIGWYMMALVECMEYIPDNHPKRRDVVVLIQSLFPSVAKYQDKQSALWFQVINKGLESSNWIETSSSAMFIYAIAKAQRKGYIDRKYSEVASRAFDSLIRDYVYFDDQGRLYLDRTVKIGTLNIKNSKGDYDYYVSTECRINDYKGISAFLYASMALEK